MLKLRTSTAGAVPVKTAAMEVEPRSNLKKTSSRKSSHSQSNLPSPSSLEDRLSNMNILSTTRANGTKNTKQKKGTKKKSRLARSQPRAQSQTSSPEAEFQEKLLKGDGNNTNSKWRNDMQMNDNEFAAFNQVVQPGPPLLLYNDNERFYPAKDQEKIQNVSQDAPSGIVEGDETTKRKSSRFSLMGLGDILQSGMHKKKTMKKKSERNGSSYSGPFEDNDDFAPGPKPSNKYLRSVLGEMPYRPESIFRPSPAYLKKAKDSAANVEDVAAGEKLHDLFESQVKKGKVKKRRRKTNATNMTSFSQATTLTDGEMDYQITLHDDEL